jgi:DNA-binding beta-propeller fold protein YncE
MESAQSLEVSPDGAHLYVAVRSDGLAVFARGSDGAAQQLPGEGGCIGQFERPGCALSRGLRDTFVPKLSPDGRHLYVASTDGIAVLARDAGTGAVRGFSGPDGCVTHTHPVYPQGCARVLDGPDYRRDPEDLEISPDGRNVYLSFSDDETLGGTGIVVFVRNPITGALTRLAGRTGCVHARGSRCTTLRRAPLPGQITISPDGRTVYGAGWPHHGGRGGGVTIFRRDQRTGGLRPLRGRRACLASRLRATCRLARGLDRPDDVAVSPDGKNVYATGGVVTGRSPDGAGAVAVFARDRRSGALRQLRGRSGCLTRRGQGRCRPIDPLAVGTKLAISRDGGNVYTAAGEVTAFARGRSGALRPLRGRGACVSSHRTRVCRLAVSLRGSLGWGLTELTVAPDGRNIYLTAGDIGSPVIGALQRHGP